MKLFGKKKKGNTLNDGRNNASTKPGAPVAEKDLSAKQDQDVSSKHANDGGITGESQKSNNQGFFSRFKRSGSQHADEDASERTEPIDPPKQVATPPFTDGTPSESEGSTAASENGEDGKRGIFHILRKKQSTEKDSIDTDRDMAAEAVGSMAPANGPSPQPELDVSETDTGPEERKTGFFKRLRKRLTKTRKAFIDRVDQLVLGKKEIDEELLEELEEILITSDIGVHTSLALIDEVREQVARKDLSNPEELKEALHDKILSFLTAPRSMESVSLSKPHVMMVVGVNGVGKTTTIGKLAARYIDEGKKVLLVAGDTFRAAAVDQLEIWAERVGADIVKHKGKADPAAVAFDGMQAAISRNMDIAIIDTAGRLHTKVNLMEELKKMRRAVGKQLPEAPHETLLVLDATTGQNAISQAELFNEAMDISGIILTKLDGTAKGGVVVGICHKLGIPLKCIGIGETVEDLQPFDPEAFMKALF